jgi:hypothetical protein
MRETVHADVQHGAPEHILAAPQLERAALQPARSKLAARVAAVSVTLMLAVMVCSDAERHDQLKMVHVAHCQNHPRMAAQKQRRATRAPAHAYPNPQRLPEDGDVMRSMSNCQELAETHAPGVAEKAEVAAEGSSIRGSRAATDPDTWWYFERLFAQPG